VHHALTDGVGGMRLLGTFVDLDRDAPAHRVTPAPVPEPVFVPFVALDGAWHTAHQAVRTAASTASAAFRSATRIARDPVGTARDAGALVGSLRRVLEPIDDTLSPLMTGRSDLRRVAVIEYPMDRLLAAAHAHGASCNDAFVAAVAGALDRYHRAHGAPVESLRMTMPISTRADGDPLGGNRFLPARFPVPVAIDDPVERMQAIGERCREWRHEPALPMTDGVATVLDHLPAVVTTQVFGGMLKHIDFLATNVPGAPVPIYVAGAKVDRFWAIAPPVGAAVNVSLISYAGTACIGVNMDAAAIRDPSLFLTCLRAGFDEVLALAPAEESLTERVEEVPA
jgi:WS/DGAT/MGAT family acyltransferase